MEYGEGALIEAAPAREEAVPFIRTSHGSEKAPAPKSITVPLISAPEAGRKTRYALFLEARGHPRRAKSSK